MSYNYKNKIIQSDEYGSYQEKFLEYANNWEDEADIETKKVKIISANSHSSSSSLKTQGEECSFEDKINSFIYENKTKIKIFDIKYQKNSVMIIYEDRKSM
jgi:hypothetical protein